MIEFLREFQQLQNTSTGQRFYFIGDRHIERNQRTFIITVISAMTNTVMRRLTTGIRFRRCANVIVCTYTNLNSTV